MDYQNRLKLPIDIGDSTTNFLTRCETPIAIGYQRIVIGGRGPYIELAENNIIRANMRIPENEVWRLTNDSAFYIEYRTNDVCNIKIYFQKKTVNYADYKPDYYYISPFDLKTDYLDVIIKSVRQSVFHNDKFF